MNSFKYMLLENLAFEISKTSSDIEEFSKRVSESVDYSNAYKSLSVNQIRSLNQIVVSKLRNELREYAKQTRKIK